MKNIKALLSQNAVTVAEEIIGWKLYVLEPDGSKTGGIIIETEAYTQDDAASHSYNGETERNKIMFAAAGTVYVYFTYGMHWCMNIVTGPKGSGEAVLIRALVPDTGIKHIKQRRNGRPPAELTNGPAKICQALNVGALDNGLAINQGRLVLLPPESEPHVRATPRVGIKRNQDALWRFVLTD